MKRSEFFRKIETVARVARVTSANQTRESEAFEWLKKLELLTPRDCRDQDFVGAMVGRIVILSRIVEDPLTLPTLTLLEELWEIYTTTPRRT